MGAEQMLLGLAQMGMGGAQSSMNTAIGMIPMGMSMIDRFRARTDPLMRQVGGILANRYNQSVGQNPYGDPYGAWGGMFGTHENGTPVGFGEAQARAIYEMMGQNPSASAIQNLQKMSSIERPTFNNASSSMAEFMGRGASPQTYVPQSIPLKSPDMKKTTKTKFNNSPNPTDTSGMQIDPRLAQGRGLIGRFAGAQMPSGGGQGGGQGGIGAQIFQNAGGFPGLMGALAQPGNALLNIRRDFLGMRGPTPVGQGGGGNPYAAFWQGRGTPTGRQGVRGYAVGTPYVQKTGMAKIHRGEAILPAQNNPFAKTGMAGNASNGMQGGGVSAGMQGGIQPPAPAGQQSLMQQLIANPMSMNQGVQDQIFNQQAGILNNAYSGALRGNLNNAAMMGNGAPSTRDLNFGLAGQLGQARQNIGIEAARTNTNDLRQATGIQMQGELGFGQLNLAQNQFENQMFNEDWARQMGLINAQQQAGQSAQQGQLGLWGALGQLGQAGINHSNPFLQQLINNQMWRIQPNPVAMGSQQVSGPPVPIGVPQYGGGGGGGQGGGGMNWAPLAQAAGMYAGNYGW